MPLPDPKAIIDEAREAAENEPEEVMEIMRRDGLRCSLVSSCNADEEALFVLRCDRDA